jgi:Zn-finger nucleic acid-binding protein
MKPMNCPRCVNATLEERDRDGVSVDICASCRGIWLDRGELEKLISRGDQDDEPPDSEDDYRRDDRRDDRAQEGRGRRRRGGFLESLGDLFD